jgi:isoleucyl-tRNA synthetase
MEQNDLRRKSLEAIREVSWKPVWGEDRISNMIANRPDWCISRQRVWGVPITVVYCKACRNPVLRAELIDHVAGIFERESSDAWYTRTVEELLPAGVRCDCGGTEFDKEYDILDVWFDSGASHHMVLDGRDNLRWPADIYLEGGDQYRGWFHSSLLVAVGTRNSAPYRSVVCHGFVLDAQGRAMHKHLGNVISPLDVAKESGAEILRLWAASADYTEDTRFGVEIAERLREAYRKLRNTARFLLGNLYDFTPAEAVSRELLGELDRWALARAAEVAERVEEAYRRYEFHVVYHALHNFCVVDLSSFYLDILKDRLYTAASGSVPRRAAQTALFLIADALVRLMAPILPFTAEEIWGRLYPKDAPVESVHMAEFSRALDQYRDPELLERWERFQQMRERTSKALEESRKSKLVGNSLEARLDIRCGGRAFDYLGSFGEQLRFLLLVSQATLSLDSGLAGDDIEVVVTRAEGSKCERCWNFAPEVGSYSDTPTVCSRCRSALKEMTLV